MPSEIIWLPGAAKDVARLREFIERKNPGAALRAAQKIKESLMLLGVNPEAGKPVEDLHPFRDLHIPFGNGNYIVRYREESHRVLITRIRHSKEESF